MRRMCERRGLRNGEDVQRLGPAVHHCVHGGLRMHRTNAVLREHESLTREFVPRADLVLFVTSADRPFTESERAFLGFKNVPPQNRYDFRVAPFRQYSSRLTTKPGVGTGEQFDQCFTRLLREIEIRNGFRSLGLDLVNSAVAAVPGVERVDVGDAFVAPVGNVNRAIGAGFAIDRAEGFIGRFQKRTGERGRETGALGFQRCPINGVVEGVAEDVIVVEGSGEGAALVDDAADGNVEGGGTEIENWV